VPSDCGRDNGREPSRSTPLDRGPSARTLPEALAESGGSANADSIAELYLVVLVIAGVIFLAVTGTIHWLAPKQRARPR
jgi:hypothetical protein